MSAVAQTSRAVLVRDSCNCM